MQLQAFTFSTVAALALLVCASHAAARPLDGRLETHTLRAAPAAVRDTAATGGTAPHGDTLLKSLRAAIDSGIVMLKANQHRAFLERFILPSQREEIVGRNGLDELAEEFAGERADRLLRAFKDTRGRRPKMLEDGTVASFKLRKKIGSHRTIEFERVDGVWYIRN